MRWIGREGLLLGFVCCALGSATAAAAPKRNIVAVFDVEDKGAGLPPSVLTRLSEYLAASLAATGAYQVVPRARLKQRLTQQKKESYRKCYDQACQIEIGKELAAQTSLSTMIMKLGSRCTLTAVLFDLRRGASEGGASVEGGCTEDSIVESIKGVLSKLMPRSATEPAGARRLLGGLLVKSDPEGAEVWLDGVRREGTTPLTLTDITAEDHLVEVRKGGRNHRTMVRVIADQFTTVTAPLRRAGLRLTVISDPPEAQIFVDGIAVGMTPKVLVDLQPGAHAIELRKDGYLAARRRLHLSHDASVQRVNVALQAAGYLVVRTDLPGAAVFIDGRPAGKTPRRLALPPGDHTVKVQMAGYVPQSKRVTVRAGQQAALFPTLTLTAKERDRLVAAAARRTRLDRARAAVERTRRAKTLWGYVTLGAGLALGAAAAVLYGVGVSQGSEAHDRYQRVQTFDQAALDANRRDVESARAKVVVADVLVGVAVVGLGFSLYELLTRPAEVGGRETRSARARRSTRVAGDGSSIALGWRF